MKLLLASSYATKFALRGQDPYTYDELLKLLPSQFGNLSYRSSQLSPVEYASHYGIKSELSAEKMAHQNLSTMINRFYKQVPSQINQYQYSNLTDECFQSEFSSFTGIILAKPSRNPINAPLDILIRISQYIRRQRKSGNLESEDSLAMTSSISLAIDTVTKFEQVNFR